MQTVLVTGAAGFIGSNLAEALLKRNYRVIGLDNLSQGVLSNMEPFARHKNFEFQQGDVRELGLIRSLVSRVDCVAHLAAYKIPRYGNALDTLLVNSEGTRNVLEAVKLENPKCRILFSSTSDVYGRNPTLPFNEGSELWMGPSNTRRWAYAVSKMYDEHLCYAYEEQFDLPIVIVRFFGGYGPRQALSWWGGPQSVFIDAALSDKAMEIHGDGKQTRSFTYIGDHVDGLLRCIEMDEALGEVFNLGYTEEITILDLAKLVWQLAGSGEPRINMISYHTFGKYDDVRRRVPDISKASQILGYAPKTTLEEGLKVTIDWQRRVSGK